MTTESSREVRRKRILDRGSDRLAFITGQARSPPPSAVSRPAPAPPPKLGGGEVEEPLPSAVRPARCDVGYELPTYEPSSTSVTDTIDRSIETGKSIESVTSIQRNGGQIQPATVHGSSHNQVANSEPQRARRQLLHEMFTAKRISSSVAASENIRVLCATLVALMVVLSYHGFPLGIIDSIISSFRPICLVFLTDLTLVVGMLFTTTKWEEKNETDAAGTAGPESSRDWTDQMGTALETALASQKVATALFLDCSLCAVIIVCGALLTHKKHKR